LAAERDAPEFRDPENALLRDPPPPPYCERAALRDPMLFPPLCRYDDDPELLRPRSARPPPACDERGSRDAVAARSRACWLERAGFMPWRSID